LRIEQLPHLCKLGRSKSANIERAFNASSHTDSPPSKKKGVILFFCNRIELKERKGNSP
jgi:hypothetical protein